MNEGKFLCIELLKKDFIVGDLDDVSKECGFVNFFRENWGLKKDVFFENFWCCFLGSGILKWNRFLYGNYYFNKYLIFCLKLCYYEILLVFFIIKLFIVIVCLV